MSFEKSEKYMEFITSILKYSHQKDSDNNPALKRTTTNLLTANLSDYVEESVREFNTEEI